MMTPGKWYARKTEDAPEQFWSVYASATDWDALLPQNESDALAIAAVPDLIAALKSTVCESHPKECDGCQFGDEFQTCSDKQYKIKAVLEKAGIEI